MSIDPKMLQRLVSQHLEALVDGEGGFGAGVNASHVVLHDFEEPDHVGHQLGVGMAFAAGVDFALEIAAIVLNAPGGDNSEAINAAVDYSRMNHFHCRNCIRTHSMITHPKGVGESELVGCATRRD